MSHISTVQVIVKDLDALKAAVAALGLEFVEGKTSFKWYSRGGLSFYDRDEAQQYDKCQHVIRVPGNDKAYEVGVAPRKDGQGWGLLFDSFAGGRGLMAMIGRNAETLTQQYATEVSVRQMRKAGYRVHQERQADGRIKLRCTRAQAVARR
jgi:hypothetical protein